MGKRVVTLERSIGIWGTKFRAVIEVDESAVRLIKGHVKGFTGVNLSAFGQSLGFGISDRDFWLTEEDEHSQPVDLKRGESIRVFKVFVTFRRIHFLLFGERQTLPIGEYRLKINSGVTQARENKSTET